MEDVVITSALACTAIFIYRYRDKIFSGTTLAIVLLIGATLDLFDWI